MTVVRLDDLDVVAGGQGLGGHFQQLEGDVHAHAHVGRHDDGDVPGDDGDLGFLRVRKTGGADDGMHAEFSANGQVRQRAFGAGEVDQHLRALKALAQVGGDGHAGVLAGKGGGILADGGAVSAVECAGQAQRVVGTNSFDQHLAHAAGGAGNRDAQRRSRLVGRAHLSGLSSGG